VLLQDANNGFWFSKNEGGSWRRLSLDSESVFFYPHSYFDNQVLFFFLFLLFTFDFEKKKTGIFDHQGIIVGYEKNHWRTDDSGESFTGFEVPLLGAFPFFSFHPDESDYLIFMGKDCPFSEECPVTVTLSSLYLFFFFFKPIVTMRKKKKIKK